jgi:hypothetical protein
MDVNATTLADLELHGGGDSDSDSASDEPEDLEEAAKVDGSWSSLQQCIEDTAAARQIKDKDAGKVLERLNELQNKYGFPSLRVNQRRTKFMRLLCADPCSHNSTSKATLEGHTAAAQADEAQDETHTPSSPESYTPSQSSTSGKKRKGTGANQSRRRNCYCVVLELEVRIPAAALVIPHRLRNGVRASVTKCETLPFVWLAPSCVELRLQSAFGLAV